MLNVSLKGDGLIFLKGGSYQTMTWAATDILIIGEVNY